MIRSDFFSVSINSGFYSVINHSCFEQFSSFAEASRFATMFSCIPHLEISISFVHYTDKL